MNYILFDDARRKDLFPLTLTRPMADIRAGILTIREKWEHWLGASTSSLTEPYLAARFPLVREANNILINGSIVPNKELAAAVIDMKAGQVLVGEDCLIAQYISSEELDMSSSSAAFLEERKFEGTYYRIQHTWDVIQHLHTFIADDYKLLTRGRKSAAISETNRIIGPENVFLEKGARMEYAVINASGGPVYIGKDAEVMEGAMIRGPFALLDHAVVKMGGIIYGPVSIGPYSKIGGEASSSVIFGYTNKAHGGFLGHSILGEWCNLGADTNTSNLKNTYEPVKVWNYADGTFVNTGLQFVGLIMGDHSKTGINTMLNTGTVVGVSANIFGAGYPRQFIPSFTWGGPHGTKNYDLNRAIATAKEVYRRRNREFDRVDEDIMREVYNLTFLYRQDQ